MTWIYSKRWRDGNNRLVFRGPDDLTVESERSIHLTPKPNTSDAKDGLPGYSFGYSDFESFFGSFIFGTFDMSASRARTETSYMKASPAVAVLSTENEDKLTWIKTGILFETLFLTATKLNLRFDLFSQPLLSLS